MAFFNFGKVRWLCLTNDWTINDNFKRLSGYLEGEYKERIENAEQHTEFINQIYELEKRLDKLEARKK